MKEKKEQKASTGAEVDVFGAMDVSVYPPQPLAATDHTRLGQLSYPDPAFGNNKVSSTNVKTNAPISTIKCIITSSVSVGVFILIKC